MQEELGYLEGGSKTLIDVLVTAIEAKGGRIHLGCPAQQVKAANNCVVGVQTKDTYFAADYVVSTIPTPNISRLVPDLPEEWRVRYDALKTIGICCVVFKLRRSVSPHFWVNLGQTAHEIPGVIEFSNLRDVGAVVVYVPYYMPTTNRKFSWTDDELVQDAFGCLVELNPGLQPEDIIDTKVARLRDAQPICDVGFAAKIPPVQTWISGLQIADTCFYYPEDRSIAESVRLGRDMARAIPS
jgi:protoporphyrinogen oxidase